MVVEKYVRLCDSCGYKSAVFNSKDALVNQTQNEYWVNIDGKDYCDECYYIDDDGNIQLHLSDISEKFKNFLDDYFDYFSVPQYKKSTLELIYPIYSSSNLDRIKSDLKKLLNSDFEVEKYLENYVKVIIKY